jgi:hypothetical protein
VGHGFAPVRHREARVGLLRLAKEVRGGLVFEVCSWATAARKSPCAAAAPEFSKLIWPTALAWSPVVWALLQCISASSMKMQRGTRLI